MEAAGREQRLRQAAILIASLERTVATEVCRHLDRDTVQRLASQIADLGPVAPDERGCVLEQFSHRLQGGASLGGRDYARYLLAEVLGKTEVDEDLAVEATAGALRSMADREPHVLWRALEHESRQMVAVVLSQLQPGQVARLLQLVPAESRAQVAYRAANLGPIAPGTLEALLRCLTESAYHAAESEGPREETGVDFLLEVLQSVDRGTERQLLEGLRQLDEEFAASVEDHLVTFEDLFRLEDRGLQTLLRQVQMQTLALALRGSEDSLRQRAQSNLSSRMQEELQQEIELMGPVRVAQVEEAQRQFTTLARDLADKGELDLRPEQAEYI